MVEAQERKDTEGDVARAAQDAARAEAVDRILARLEGARSLGIETTGGARAAARTPPPALRLRLKR